QKGQTLRFRLNGLSRETLTPWRNRRRSGDNRRVDRRKCAARQTQLLHQSRTNQPIEPLAEHCEGRHTAPSTRAVARSMLLWHSLRRRRRGLPHPNLFPTARSSLALCAPLSQNVPMFRDAGAIRSRRGGSVPLLIVDNDAAGAPEWRDGL